jgi:hypothetical protein
VSWEIVQEIFLHPKNHRVCSLMLRLENDWHQLALDKRLVIADRRITIIQYFCALVADFVPIQMTIPRDL